MRFVIPVSVLSLLLLAAGCATSSHHVSGSVQASTYTSTRGHFSVPFPVSRDMGGRVLTDGPRSVTFRDNWGARITFSCLPFSERSSMMDVLYRDGPEKALTEFAQREYGSATAVHFHPDTLAGAATLAFVRATGQRTGVAVFVRNHAVYLVETDLLPGVQMLGRNDDASVRERDHWLEDRALALAQTMDIR